MFRVGTGRHHEEGVMVSTAVPKKPAPKSLDELGDDVLEETDRTGKVSYYKLDDAGTKVYCTKAGVPYTELYGDRRKDWAA